MKEYITPAMSVIRLHDDVIRTSGPVTPGGTGPDPCDTWEEQQSEICNSGGLMG